MEFITYLKPIGIVSVLTLVLSCEKITTDSPTENEDTTFLNLYMDNPIEDGYYIFDYPNGSESSYTSVLYQTEPIQRVFWYSEDTFTFIYWGEEMNYPIINNSTYSDVDGDGKQMIYIYPPHLGDTLSVIGCIGEICEELEFIVK